ncbi:hypothetical protein NE237_012602 [Protea cynaroides]|uniref:Uncharacterized protein n=1 Tax=Protea cynaroides TaxID=273540 RepID=A0A9Q0JX12_9MAGN|nr:hypothetical protein NE237_012602 [Protea cynaroides]
MVDLIGLLGTNPVKEQETKQECGSMVVVWPSNDISGELQRFACLPSLDRVHNPDAVDLEPEPNSESLMEPWLGFLQRENLSSEIVDNARSLAKSRTDREDMR